MNLYSLGMAAAMLLCLAAFILLDRPRGNMAQTLLIAGCAAMGGLIAARLVYWLGAFDLLVGRTHTVLSFFWWQDGGFSLFGAVAGSVGAAWLACRTLKAVPPDLDALALPVLLLAAEGRLMEWTGAQMDAGPSMESPAWLTVAGEYGRNLNVALMEALLIACAAAFLILRMRRTGALKLRDALFLLGLVETLAISLRRDNYMMWGFVHQEQLYFYLLSAAALILTGFERRRPWPAFGAALLTAGLVIFWEFALDGRILVPFDFLRDNADLFWYSLFALTLIGCGCYYFRLRRDTGGSK